MQGLEVVQLLVDLQQFVKFFNCIMHNSVKGKMFLLSVCQLIH